MAITKTINLEVNAKGAKKGIDDVTNSTKKLDKANSNTSKSNNSLSASTAKTGVAMGGVATASTTAAGSLTALGGTVGAAAGGMAALKTKLQAVIVSLKSVKVAMMATGIGLVIVLLASLKAAFTRSEEGQDKFAKAMAALGAVTGVLMDGLAALGGLIIDVFTKPKKVFEDFNKSLKEFVTDKIAKVTEGLGLLGSAIKKAFSGDFSGALEDAKDGMNELNNGLNPIKIGADAVAKSIKGIVTEMKKEAKIAGQIADIRAKADKVDRALIIDRAEANRKRAELLDKAANKEKFTAKERIEFLTEAGKIEDAITEKEISAAQLRLKARIAENKLGLSDKEALDDEARLRAKLIDLQGAKLTKQKLVTSQISAANKEAAADQKALEVKAAAEAQKIADFTANTKEEKRKAEKEKLKEQLEELLKLAGDDNDAKIELQKSFDERLLELKNKHAEDDAKAQKVIDDKKAAKEIEFNKQLEDAEIGLQEAKANAVKGGLEVLGQLAGKSKALAAGLLIVEKGLAIAEVVTNAAKAIAKAKGNLAATPISILGAPNPMYPLQVAATAKGILSTKISAATSIATIAAQAIPGLSGGGGGGGSVGGLGGGSDGGAQPPAFNIVGASGETQLADAIGGQSQRPARAYVVSNDVTTAQELDRNIIEGASI